MRIRVRKEIIGDRHTANKEKTHDNDQEPPEPGSGTV